MGHLDVPTSRDTSVEGSRRSNIGLSLATMLALSTWALIYEPRPARAEAVTEGMSWSAGLAALKNDARRVGPERIGEFIIGTAHAEWIGSNTGDETSVLPDPTRKVKLQKSILAREIKQACEGHVHSVAAVAIFGFSREEALRAFKIKGYAVSIPPGSHDIDRTAGDSYRWSVKDLRPDGTYVTITVPTITSLVVDPRGVWYYRAAVDADYASRPDILKVLEARKVMDAEWNHHLDHRLESLSDIRIDEIIAESSDHMVEIEKEYQNASTIFLKKTLFKMLVARGSPTAIAWVRTDAASVALYEKWEYEVWEATKMDEAALFELQKAYIRATLKGSVPRELKRNLEIAYLWLRGKVRFVVHEETDKEPMCAGVDYAAPAQPKLSSPKRKR